MIILGLIALVHALLMIWLGINWNQIKAYNPQKRGGIFLSVIIPVRNEAENIALLLKDLLRQDYDPELFEVIIINDHSDDETTHLVKEVIASHGDRFRLIHLNGTQGKKAASTRGVKEAKSDYILCTDGDCRVPVSWISDYASFFEEYDPYMISGPVKMVGPRFFDRVQAMDFSALLAFGAASLQRRMASNCNGANMAYRKDIFQEVEGYKGNEQLPSGDDEFLLQKVFARYPDRVRFMKSPTAIVETAPKHSVKEFIQQRLRWMSKSRFYNGILIRLSLIFTYLDFVSVFVIVGAVLMGYAPWWVGLLILSVRWMSESWYLIGPARFLSIPRNPLHMWTVSFIYPFYVLFLGFASIFGSYSWKGRRYG